MFEYFILLIILLNTIVLGLKYEGMSENFTNVTEQINDIFTVVFLIEAICKLLGMGKSYFKDGWNLFDFLIVLGSLAFVLAGIVNPEISSGQST